MKISKVVLLIIMLIVVSCGGGQKTVQTDPDRPDWVDRGGVERSRLKLPQAQHFMV